MPRIRPEFMKSPYFIDELGNWRLKPGAPKELEIEFELYMQSMEENDEPGSINGNTIDFPFPR